MRWLIAVIVAFLAFLYFSATVVKNTPKAAASGQDEIQVYFSADKFDAEGYVNDIWESKVVPYVKNRAVDVMTLKQALKDDPKAAAAKYGHRAVAEHNPFNYAVSGKVKILEVNTKSKNGKAEADVFPFDGKADLTLQIGPIYKGTSLRDLLDFVSFDDFKNQVEFAKLASQLNLGVRDKVVGPLKIDASTVGKVYDMIGATTNENDDLHFNVVPVIMTPASE